MIAIPVVCLPVLGGAVTGRRANRNRADRPQSGGSRTVALNGKFGSWTAVTATQGFKREWKLRSEMRSPAWTTRIADVPTVRA
jgi:hypothetical protein